MIRAIPTGWVTGLLGQGQSGATPLAALVDGGMGTGAALAFLVTGAGASIGSVSGLLVIARRRVVGLVLAILPAGGMLMGFAGEMIF